MLGEVTMVQLYSVALTAGKAHKDHKHHHVHHFDHDGQAITTPAPPTPTPRVNQPQHPLLTSGQINPQLGLNLAQPTPVAVPDNRGFSAQLLNGQFAGRLASQQLLSQGTIVGGLTHPSLTNPANVQFVDATSHQLVKRQAEMLFVDDGDFLHGLATFEGNAPVIKQQQQKDEREPAEAEVGAVMRVCGGCDEEPFAKALVFAWRTVPKKLFSGAIYMPAQPHCRLF